MSGNTVTLKDRNGSTVYPRTSSEVVYMPDGKSTVAAELSHGVKHTPYNEEHVEINYPGLDREVQSVKENIKEISASLDNNVRELDNKKMNKTDLVTMANMGQDVKEAMTGGSVAVVGKNAVLSENIVDKQITTKKLSDDIRVPFNSLIELEKNLIDIDYLNKPLSFISYYNSSSTSIVDDNINKINGFKTLNIQSNSSGTHWNMTQGIPYTKQGKLTFSYLRKATLLNGQNVNAVDNNNKWYGGSADIINNYYKGWDLVKYTITVNTDITSIKFYLGNYNGENNYNVGLFSLVEGEYCDIVPKWGLHDLQQDVQDMLFKQTSEYEVLNIGGVLVKTYSQNPKTFITWNNTSSSTIKNNETIIENFISLNAVVNSTGNHYLNSIDIRNISKGVYTFSYLRRINSGSGRVFTECMDSNSKYYTPNGAVETVVENYYNDYDLVNYEFEVTTDVTKIVLLIAYNGTSNFDIGMFSLWNGTTKLEIINSSTITYEKLDDNLKNKINQIGSSTLNVLDYDMLLPRKIFMINDEPLRLYKKNIVVSADNIRDLELSVSSYDDQAFWDTAKQPYVDYINDKLELSTSNIINNKVTFNLVGNELKTRLVKDIQVVRCNKADVSGKSIIVNMFGDSTTHNGLNYAINKLLVNSYGLTRKCIGTKVVNGVAGEARGGWLYNQYIGYRTTYSHNDQAITEADFPNFLKLATSEDKLNKGDWCFTRTGSNREKTYNEVVAESGDITQNFYIFDYSHYLATNNFEKPTFVTLGMGINDEWKYPSDYITLCDRALNIIIKQIHEASPDTKFILMPFPTKGSNEVKVEWFKKCLELETYFRDTVGVDIELVAEHISQNKDLFFPTTKTDLSDKVADKHIINDNIHTNYAGYSEGARPIVYCMLNKLV